MQASPQRIQINLLAAIKQLIAFCLALNMAWLIVVSLPRAGYAAETWEKLDKRLKSQVYQLNVGLKIRLRSGQWAQFSDFSPKYRYPVYSTSNEDNGYRVVNFGSAFPVRTSRSDKVYFITNRHVVDASDNLVKECERFFAGVRLYAEQTAGGADPDKRYQELLSIINLSTKKNLGGAERTLYQSTVDAIWDTYDTYLSVKADPSRLLFQKYANFNEVQPDIGYFLHSPGPVTQPALQAQLYKVAHNDSDPDLAILTVPPAAIAPLEFDLMTPAEGQEIQVIGYPAASDQIDADSSNYYAPTFNSGRISRVTPHILQVDAPITTGNSGGPVVSQRGKVIGVVAVRALSARGGELPNFGGAITIQSVQSFAPELFDKISAR